MARKQKRRWRSRSDEGHALRMAIGDLARAAAEPGWSRLVVRRAQVGAYAVTTVTRDGHEIIAEGMDEPFQRLRELSYRADAGTWFTCELAFSAGTRGCTGRVDSSARPFEHVPALAALAELTTFPRAEPPAWLLDALPTAAPIGLPTTYGDCYDRWRDGDQPPPPPITGGLAYHPARTLIARSFAQRERHGGRHRILLSGQADDPQAEFLLVESNQELYGVGRHGGTRGALEGIRSVTLDGTVLRLELTPEAADLLETETTFEVGLDLPSEQISELRTALAAMLKSVAEPPELIGF
ncbi:hypothetical protein EDD27_9702 [Nonomuraea polychroma]|uniref:Uncharacterized protein n=1 Tax=Nonomuraea polychroma TaxID=46176 RepID=A0A438MM09_9ACTN|nr:hypothetical protein [Nonomuraea polychroma]RVX46798.1 hypothetical protein EDD27_9702 [Nonomuraea polychroma]